MVTASPPRSRRPQVGCRPAGISEASWTARRGLFCPWPASVWEAVLPAPQPGTGVPVLLPEKTPRQPELLYIRQGWICPAPRPGPFTGWRTDAQVAQGARVDTFREAHRQPPTSSRLRPLRESWVSILRCLEILGTSWYQEAGENTFLLSR